MMNNFVKISVDEVVFPAWGETVNEAFVPLVYNKDRYLICYGGRGSSKSVFAAKKLISRCLREKYFRYILYRRTYNTIRDSQYQTIKDIVEEWGLQDMFEFALSPLEIRCKNGNKFICRGGDEPKKLKSIKDPTGVWYEEEIPEEGDFITITTSIRTKKTDYLQEILTINPEVEGDYTRHWFWKRFFKDKPEGTFTDTTEVNLSDGKIFTTSYTCHHSTYLDNRWLPDSFKAQLMELKQNNPYYYTIYALGRWGNKTTDGNFYKLFDRIRNTRPESECMYNPHLALHVTFDFNVHPYLTMCVWQVSDSTGGTTTNGTGSSSTGVTMTGTTGGISTWLAMALAGRAGGSTSSPMKLTMTGSTGVVKKVAVQIDELCMVTPNNRTDMACRRFAEVYRGHTSGLFIYGDPSGVREDTRTEMGYNDYRIIMRELAVFKPVARWQKVAPAVHVRGMFINAIFANEASPQPSQKEVASPQSSPGERELATQKASAKEHLVDPKMGVGGLNLIISERCVNTIADYMMLKEAADGRKEKTRVKNPQTGVSYEKYGHTSDANDYFICRIFSSEYACYQRGGRPIEPPLFGKPYRTSRVWDGYS